MTGSDRRDPRLVPLVCPSCRHEHTPAVRVVAETSRRAAKRPVVPEIVAICPSCGTLLILSLHPASPEVVAS